MKKLIAFVISAVMLLSAFSFGMLSVSAETGSDSQGLKYSLSDDKTYYIVNDYYSKTVTDLVIPAEFN